MDCPVCHDAQWVCDDHPDRPWGTPNGCDCGGAGALVLPAIRATGTTPPQLPEGYRSLIRKGSASESNIGYRCSPQFRRRKELADAEIPVAERTVFFSRLSEN
jgi:hypothetical protein